MPGRYRFSMPSSRDHTDPWFRVGTIDVTTTVLVASVCVVSFFAYAADPASLHPFWLFASDVRSGQIWRLVTWPLANEPTLFTALAILIFWYLGSQIEARLGRVRYVWLLLLVTVIPALLATLFDVSLGGLRALELAIFVVFACENPRTPFFFGIPAWILAAVIVGIDILQLIGARQSEVILVYLASIVTAVWTARSFGMIGDFPWLPQIKLPGSRRGPRRRPARRSTATLGGTGRGGGGGGGKVVVDGPWPTAPVYRPMQDQAEVDQILDKIALVGMDGLTPDEKKRLNEASKRLRKNGS